MMMGGGWLIWLVILMLFVLLIGGVVAVVVWFIAQGSRGRSPGPARQDEALEILRQRYARGEIDREEFLQMREELAS
jgi:putative membrane protein